jgi:hypothetical protein
VKVLGFGLAYLALWFLAWCVTGLIFGFGFNIATRFSWTLVPSVIIVALAGGLAYQMLPTTSSWKIAAICLLVATLLDVRYHLAVREFAPGRLVVTLWESFWPAVAAYFIAERTPAKLSKSKSRALY